MGREGQPGTEMKGYRDFEFDLPAALLQRLIEILDSMETAPLSDEAADLPPEVQGVYQLFFDDALVYIGKTDNQAGLRKRLMRHATKVLHRQNLDPSSMSFKAVRIYVFTPMDLEADLIRHYGGVGTIAWNGSGFGSNDPGRERDTTLIKEGNFDLLFPVDIDRTLEADFSSARSAADLVTILKTAVPYTFRYQQSRRGSRKHHDDLVGSLLKKVPRHLTMRQALEFVVSKLPGGWQATAFPSHTILYKETRDYPQGVVISRS